jgi:hypothetical protein
MNQRQALEMAQEVMRSWQGQAPVGFNEAFQAVNQALEQPAAWVGLEKADMPDGDNPMYDHDYFIKGMVWADIKLREKNGGA